ncbi:MAG: MerC domain-containing protein [Nevskia sp.]|nr:MerC domain-containing protein [Nevskia sp.]
MKPVQSNSSDEWLGRLDRLGIVLSGICIVHCLALPLLLAALPLVGGSVFGGHAFHEWLLVAVVPVSLVALGFGYRRHGDANVMRLGGAGLALLCFATYGYRLVGLSEDWERAISIVGGLIHAAGHVLNFRRTRAVHEAQCTHAPMTGN